MDRFHGLKIGLQAWTLRNFDLPDAVERTVALGLRHLELGALGKPGVDPANPAKTAQAVALCRAAGLHTECVNPRMPSEPSEAALRPLFDMARQIGARTITGGIDLAVLPVLERLANEYDMTIGMHNHGPGGALSSVEAIAAILKPFGRRIGLCVDTGHYLRLPLDPLSVLRAFPDRVHSIHLRDMDPDKDPVKGDGGQYKEYIVGEGPLNLKGLMALLAEWKYQGTIALEYKPNPDNPLPDLRKALANIESALGGLQ